jgi:hypothetical protein
LRDSGTKTAVGQAVYPVRIVNPTTAGRWNSQRQKRAEVVGMLRTVLVSYVVLVALVFLLSVLWNLYIANPGLRIFKKRGNQDEKAD